MRGLGYSYQDGPRKPSDGTTADCQEGQDTDHGKPPRGGEGGEEPDPSDVRFRARLEGPEEVLELPDIEELRGAAEPQHNQIQNNTERSRISRNPQKARVAAERLEFPQEGAEL